MPTSRFVEHRMSKDCCWHYRPENVRGDV
jgi:hypothetical protein